MLKYYWTLSNNLQVMKVYMKSEINKFLLRFFPKGNTFSIPVNKASLFTDSTVTFNVDDVSRTKSTKRSHF